MRTELEIKKTLLEEKAILKSYDDGYSTSDEEYYYTLIGWIEALEYVLKKEEETK